MKKITKLTGILAALTLIFALGACANGAEETNKPESKNENKGKEILEETFASTKVENIESIDGVYYFEYEGDYGLNAIVEADIKTADELKEALEEIAASKLSLNQNAISLSMNFDGAGCTSITADKAGSDNEKIFGRNFDYPNGTAMVIHTKPTSGYESISTSYPYYLADEVNWTPSQEKPKEAIGFGLIFVPMDGMNEKGFYISILEAGGKHDRVNQDEEGKHHVQTTVAVRYLLDNAKSVEEALELLESLNMHDALKTAYHFALADNTGKSVVVEYINNEMKVQDAKVVTNHYLVENSGKTAPKETADTLLRYNTAKAAGEAAGWKMTPEQMRNTLKAAAAKQYDDKGEHISIWSAVYEPSAKKVTYYFREDYTKYAEVTFGN